MKEGVQDPTGSIVKMKMIQTSAMINCSEIEWLQDQNTYKMFVYHLFELYMGFHLIEDLIVKRFLRRV